MNTKNVVAIDFETGGTKHWECAITQVAAVRFVAGTELETFYSMVKPEGGGTISQEALDMQGATYEELMKKGKPAHQVAAGLSVFLWDAHRAAKEDPLVVVAHFGRGFDFHLLRRFMENVERGYDPPFTVDTHSLALDLMGMGVLPSQGAYLGAMCRMFDIDPGTAHRPVDDARACGLLYLALAEEVRKCR